MNFYEYTKLFLLKRLYYFTTFTLNKANMGYPQQKICIFVSN